VRLPHRRLMTSGDNVETENAVGSTARQKDDQEEGGRIDYPVVLECSAFMVWGPERLRGCMPR
jgi:hypothetical protein